MAARSALRPRGFCLLQKPGSTCGLAVFPLGKSALASLAGLETYCAPGGLAGGNRLFPAGWQAGERRPQKGGQAMRLGGGGRTARGAAVFCRPGGPAKPKQGRGPEAPAPALCALCAPAARGGWDKPGPTLYGPGRRKTLVGRGGAGRDALGKAAAHDLRAAAASFACRGLPGQENCSGRCANIAVRAAPPCAQGL